jgi:hypothetical protein
MQCPCHGTQISYNWLVCKSLPFSLSSVAHGRYSSAGISSFQFWDAVAGIDDPGLTFSANGAGITDPGYNYSFSSLFFDFCSGFASSAAGLALLRFLAFSSAAGSSTTIGASTHSRNATLAESLLR